MTGQVTARNAQPGLLVEPGTAPPPFAVAPVTSKWMLANVLESDSPLYHIGQPVEVTVMALPGPHFAGRYRRSILRWTRIRIASPSDPRSPTRRNELRSGMLADFVIQVRAPVRAPAVPTTTVVREGDGTMTAWVTTDRRHMTQRMVDRRAGARWTLPGARWARAR